MIFISCKWPFWWNECHMKIFMLVIKIVLNIIFGFFIRFIESSFDCDLFKCLKIIFISSNKTGFNQHSEQGSTRRDQSRSVLT